MNYYVVVAREEYKEEDVFYFQGDYSSIELEELATQEVRDNSDLALTNSRSHDGDGTYTTAISKATDAVNTANAADAIADNAKLATDRLVATTSDGGNTWTVAGNKNNATTDPKGVG